MSQGIFDRNMEALRGKNGDLFRLVSLSGTAGSDYAGSQLSSTGKPVPVFSDGVASHSLRDPEREAARFADSIPNGCFVLFGGLAALDSLARPVWAYGTRIHDYCERRPHYDAAEFVE